MHIWGINAYQGRMEFGARALGNRSLLADPHRRDMRDVIHLRIKFREKFRPFAPSILEEYVGEWFEVNEPAPYMEKVFCNVGVSSLPRITLDRRCFLAQAGNERGVFGAGDTLLQHLQDRRQVEPRHRRGVEPQAGKGLALIEPGRTHG